MAGDAVSVAVCGDCACGPPPDRGLVLVAGWGSDGFGPGRVLGQGGVEDGVGARFDECFSFVEGGSHLGVAHAVGVWDEAGDEAWRFPSSS